MSLSKVSDVLGIAWLDISTGEFYTQEYSLNNEEEDQALAAILARLSPSELIVSDSYLHNPNIFGLLNSYRKQLSVWPDDRFNSENARKHLQKVFSVQTLDAFGNFSRSEISAAGVLIDYVETGVILTQDSAINNKLIKK